MNQIDQEKQHLHTICQGTIEEHGTLRTHVLDLAYDVRRQIKKLDNLGVPRVEIQEILDKYTNQIVKMDFVPKRKTDK